MAIVVRSEFEGTGTIPLTPPDFPLQLMMMVKREGEVAKGHFHRPVVSPRKRDESRHEIVHVIRGEVKIELFDLHGKPVDQVRLGVGDTALLTAGHKVTYLQDAKVLEIKEGPYPGSESDKMFLEV